MSELKLNHAEVVGVMSEGAIEDPSVEAWFLVSIYYDAMSNEDAPTRQQITKDGISYYPWNDSKQNRMHYTQNERIAVRKAIKRYVANVEL